MSIVIQTTTNQLRTFAQHYPSNTTVPVGAIFRYKGSGVMVTGYKSGKVMFQGQNELAESQKWASNALTTNSMQQTSLKRAKTNPVPSNLPDNLAQLGVLGSDEVGTGSYFGPLTVVAVYVAPDQITTLQSLGIADSKTLTDANIASLAEKLINMLPYHIVNIMPTTYNQYNQTLNANEIKAHGHNRALSAVLAKIAPHMPDAILIDQFTPANTYWRYLSKLNYVVKENVYFATKAEQLHVAVAAASIIARYVELKSLQELSAQAHCELPVGAGKNVDKIAAKLLHQGIDLRQYAKLHFANTKKAYSIAENN
ncbi:ribonuclease HIII [Periweissella fabalis]|uniref:Ribonuclease HIII n=1 Tax=Periweissella fabalis TaxID=1070421 RepID=A0A7X6S3W5_9LACO|nr:ribonuclease HIII [Periweissella fabalis]NKZ24666.1 ribonuclease HIII [Periweissella fabalis]